MNSKNSDTSRIQRSENFQKKDIKIAKFSWLIFTVFLALLIIDRVLTLVHFGFVYTDLDQIVMWNGAVDYSQGIFHEPFFYGQSYNYMLESFLAVPLLNISVPVYYAVPIVTCVLSLVPFVVLGILLQKHKYYFWALSCLAIPIILPLEYNMLSTLSRGFVQAHLFIPFLFFPLLNPKNPSNIVLLYAFSALSFMANKSSVMLVLPIFLYVYSFNFKSRSFYLKSVIVIPILFLDFLAKNYYKIHPEKIVHKISGVKLDGETFLSSLTNPSHFEFLFPLHTKFGIIYPFLFLILIAIAVWQSKKRALIFVVSIFVLMLITFAIPKVQTIYLNGGLFFTPSRLYLILPLILILSLFILFKKKKISRLPIFIMLAFCLTIFTVKNVNLQTSIDEIVASTSFPVIKNEVLITRAAYLEKLSSEHDVDLIVCSTQSTWKYYFDNYAWHPLTQNKTHEKEALISILDLKDRRTWSYDMADESEVILLYGFNIADSLLTKFDYEIVDYDKTIIKNNLLSTKELFNNLNLAFGN